MAVDPEWLRRIQQQALAGAQQNPVQNFNPEMLAANASMPNPNMGGGLGGMLRRGAIGFQNGLGRLQQGLFPIDSASAAGMSAEDIKNARNQAMLRMGLGMMSSANQGARGGETLAAGFGLAQGGMTDDLQRRMANERVARQEQRQTERDAIGDERYAEQFQYQQQQDRVRQEMERQQQEESRRRFEESLSLDRAGLGLRAAQLQMSTLGRGLLSEEEVREAGFSPGTIVQRDGKGGLKVLQKGSEAKLPEGTQRAMSYLARMQNAEENLAKNGYAPKGVSGAANIAASMLPGGNFLVSENFQKYQSSAREWISGVLRYDSGAAVPDTEFDRYFKTWFAQPGDSAETIAQKEQMRVLMAESVAAGLPKSALEKMARQQSSAFGAGWSIEEVD